MKPPENLERSRKLFLQKHLAWTAKFLFYFLAETDKPSVNFGARFDEGRNKIVLCFKITFELIYGIMGKISLDNF